MNAQKDDVRNRWVKRPSYLEDYTFTELFTQNLLDREGVKQ